MEAATTGTAAAAGRKPRISPEARERVLLILADGPKSSVDLAGNGKSCDVGLLHALWREQSIQWDWDASLWRLPPS